MKELMLSKVPDATYRDLKLASFLVGKPIREYGAELIDMALSQLYKRPIQVSEAKRARVVEERKRA